jgi:Tol biopolymer transport system component
MSLLLFASLPTFAGEPLGYFTNVRAVSGVDRGPWRDEMGSVSADQREVYFFSDYGTSPQPDFASAGRTYELYVARRSSLDEPFGERERLDVSIDGVQDVHPIISSDGLRLTFDSDRPGSPTGGVVTWVSTRESIDAPWSNPVLAIEHFPIESPAASATNITMPNISADGLSMFFVQPNGSNPANEDIYSASRASTNEPFTNVIPLDQIMLSSRRERNPSLSFDGRTLFFNRTQLNFGSPEIRVAHRESTDVPFENSTTIDGFSMGRRAASPHADARLVHFDNLAFAPYISADWPADGSKLYYTSACCVTNWNIYEATWRQATPTPGDMTSDGILDVDDINLITKAVRLGVNAPGFDLNADNEVHASDRDYWVESLANTWYGDANLDGRVDATDLNVLALSWRADDTTSWGQGDFNGDGLVNAADLNDLALNWRSGTLQASAVPEPSAVSLLWLASLAAIVCGRSFARIGVRA